MKTKKKNKIECPLFHCKSKEFDEIEMDNPERIGYVCKKCKTFFSAKREYFEEE